MIAVAACCVVIVLVSRLSNVSQWEKPADYDGPDLDEITKAANAAAESASADVMAAATGSVLASGGAAAAADAAVDPALSACHGVAVGVCCCDGIV